MSTKLNTNLNTFEIVFFINYPYWAYSSYSVLISNMPHNNGAPPAPRWVRHEAPDPSSDYTDLFIITIVMVSKKDATESGSKDILQMKEKQQNFRDVPCQGFEHDVSIAHRSVLCKATRPIIDFSLGKSNRWFI